MFDCCKTKPWFCVTRICVHFFQKHMKTDVEVWHHQILDYLSNSSLIYLIGALTPKSAQILTFYIMMLVRLLQYYCLYSRSGADVPSNFLVMVRYACSAVSCRPFHSYLLWVSIVMLTVVWLAWMQIVPQLIPNREGKCTLMQRSEGEGGNKPVSCSCKLAWCTQCS